ncbi:hypothetical protein AGMMS49940_21270 [Spirochaetia bacterium]|nr:hypothetical protein AGMMS49940_21270 [Spirochaetia bacterium]
MKNCNLGHINANTLLFTDWLTTQSVSGNYPWGPEYMFMLKNPFNVYDSLNVNDAFIEALSNIKPVHEVYHEIVFEIPF